MGKVITNSTYSFVPQPHSIFTKENLDPKTKILVVNSKKGGKK